ncbi:hypothetical protein HPC49_15365 [Pyxidicoccus fallax]|nr:Ig-like domain-containing protein [Pyxidicoccus fallax]NPC79598.1 hypothetical protein [Pyxidicoccus fallax]
MGGGGGAGHGTASSGSNVGGPGGAGGGIVFIRAGQLEGTGSILASGSSGEDGTTGSGGGGGGAGGSIQVRIAGFAECSAIRAEGGLGGNQGPDAGNTTGGQGAGGSVLFQAGHVVGTCALSTDAGSVAASGSTTVLDGGLTQLAPPVVTSPGSGQLINTLTPTVQGTAPGSSNVVIYLVDGGTLSGGSRTANGNAPADGTFGVPLTLPDSGTYVIQAAAERDGVQSLKSPLTTFTVDVNRPVVSILGPTGTPGPTSTRNPIGSFGFTSTETMRQYECQLALRDAGITDAGFAVCQPLTTFDAGSAGGRFTVWVRGTDLAGNTNSPLAFHDWTVDTLAPNAPVITSPDAGDYLKSDASVPVVGRADTDSTVLVYLDGIPNPSAVAVQADGGWSRLLDNPGNGFHIVTATASDNVGNTSVFSNSVFFLVDGTAPNAPVFVTPAADARLNTRDAGITGLAEPDSVVTVQVREFGSSTVVATRSGTANAQGSWEVVAVTPPQATPPSEGVEYEATAVAMDRAGNPSAVSAGRRFHVDLAPPSITQVTGPANPTNGLEARFTFTASEPVQSFECQLGSAAAEPCATPYSLQLASPGDYTLIVRAIDLAGNRTVDAGVRSYTWTVDRGPPDAPDIRTPDAGVFTRDTRPVISGTAESDSRVQVYFNGAPLLAADAGSGTPGPWSVQPATPLSEGFYLLTATATDPAGNTGPFSSTVSFTVDTTAPGTPVVTSPARQAHVNSASPTLTGTAEPHSVVAVRLNGQDAGTVTVSDAGTWTLPLAGLSNTEQSIRATATDRAGNTSPETDPAHAFTVDILPPGMPAWASGLAGSYLATRSPVLRGTASEPGLDILVSVNDAGVGTATVDDAGTWSIYVPGPLAETEHSASAVARDRAGNLSDAGVVRFNVDVQPPDTEILRGPPQDTSLATVDFDVRSSDPEVSEFQCSKNRAAFTNCNATLKPDAGTGVYSVTMSGFEVSDAGVTPQEVMIRAVDRAMNVDDTPDSYSWRMVSGTLTVGIGLEPDEFVSGTEVVYSFTSQRPGAGFRGTLTNVTTSEVTNFFTGMGVDTQVFSGLFEGEYELRVRATDGTNETTEHTARRFTVDRTAPPAATDIEPLEGAFVKAGGSFSGRAEPRATVEISIPGTQGETVLKVPVQNSGSWSIPFGEVMEEGVNTVTITVVDRASNRSALSVDRTFTFDKTSPQLTQFTMPAAVTSDTTPDFVVSASEPVNFACTLNSVAVDCAAPDWTGNHSFTLSADRPLGEAIHSMTLTLRDRAGNENMTPIFYSWQVDFSPPTATIEQGPVAHTRAESATFRFRTTEPPGTFVCELDGNAIPCTRDLMVPTPEERRYTLRVAARDQAQNLGSFSDLYTWEVDRTAPQGTIVESPAEGAPIRNAAATFSGRAEANSVVSVLVDDVKLPGEAVADAQGKWTFVAQEPLQLAQGLHVVQARATDAAKNDGPPSEGRTFLFDTEAPTTVIESGPAEGERVRSVAVAFRFSSEPDATFQCTVDGAEVECGQDLNINTSEERFYTLKVQAVDVAGNVDPVGVTRRWRVYLGNDLRTRGGGLSCASTAAGGTPAVFLALGVLALLAARRRR